MRRLLPIIVEALGLSFDESRRLECFDEETLAHAWVQYKNTTFPIVHSVAWLETKCKARIQSLEQTKNVEPDIFKKKDVNINTTALKGKTIAMNFKDKMNEIEDPIALQKKVNAFPDQEYFNKLSMDMKALAFAGMWAIQEDNNKKIADRGRV